MNLDNLISWAVTIVLAAAACGQMDWLQDWVWRAEANLVYESRTETWGSPRFFPLGLPNHQSAKDAFPKK